MGQAHRRASALEGQIARPVLVRARTLYLQKVNEGVVGNPCYFAMAATHPNISNDGKPEPRFYIVCEAERSFRAIELARQSERLRSEAAGPILVHKRERNRPQLRHPLWKATLDREQ